ncbi:MAG: Hypothetical protein AJITA_00032 [Acetilactobacillus jinshanensis]
MRHQDPRGDYGRQLRQRQVLFKEQFTVKDLANQINQLLKYKHFH